MKDETIACYHHKRIFLCYFVVVVFLLYSFFNAYNRFECTKDLKARFCFSGFFNFFSFLLTLKVSYTSRTVSVCHWLPLSLYSRLFLSRMCMYRYHFVCCSSCNSRTKLYFPERERLLVYKDIFFDSRVSLSPRERIQRTVDGFENRLVIVFPRGYP